MEAPKIILVTGGNTGLGYEIVKALLESAKPYHVLLGSRSVEKGNAAVEKLKGDISELKNNVEVVPVDLASDESIEAACEYIRSTFGRLDALVNNAGATYDISYLSGKMGLRECFNKAYDTNVSGTNVMTHAAIPLLLKSNDPRLLFVAGLSMINKAYEGPYFPTPPQPAGWPKPKIQFETIGYRCSKTALNMLFIDWRHRLAADPVKVWCVGPGMMLTDLGRDEAIKIMAKEIGALHPSKAGNLMKEVIEGGKDDLAGKMMSFDGESGL